jgi:hypothetical protein
MGPAAIAQDDIDLLRAGVDAAAVRAGAAATLSQALAADGAADVPAAVGAALSFRAPVSGTPR